MERVNLLLITLRLNEYCSKIISPLFLYIKSKKKEA